MTLENVFTLVTPEDIDLRLLCVPLSLALVINRTFRRMNSGVFSPLWIDFLYTRIN